MGAKDWLLLLLGAVLGLLLQNIAFPLVVAWLHRERQRYRSRRINSAWQRYQRLIPRLQLVQAGWSPKGTFTPEYIRVRLMGEFKLPDQLKTARVSHDKEWRDDNQTDGEQVGIKALNIYRISDTPMDEQKARAHIVDISAQTYRYFDFLATHRLLTSGSPDEKRLLRSYATDPNPEEPIVGFPNPLSVGLSLFCEDGRLLAIGVRTKKAPSGGQWEGGKLFNAVAENATPNDFSVNFDGYLESSPFVTARRALYQEAGFSQDEIHQCELEIHSLAWASDILDHKFFGWALTSLAEAEVRNRWEHAPDHHEYREILFFDVGSRAACLRFWRGEVIASAQKWSPEGLFCTARCLVLRGLLRAGDLVGT